MNFFCAINSNDKKKLYLINDKKKDSRKDMTNPHLHPHLPTPSAPIEE